MNRPELVKTLELVGDALSSTSMIPIFGCYCFRDGKVYAFNDLMAIVTSTEVKISFAVHGPTLLGLLQAGSTDDVNFQFVDKSLVITCDRSVMDLSYMREDDFIFEPPVIDKNDPLLAHYHCDENFLNGLEVCLTTASNDPTQGAIMGVTVDKDFLFSCNGDAITRFSLGGANGSGAPHLLPNAFCKALLKVPRSPESKLTLCTGWAIAECGPVTIYGRLTTNPKPFDYQGNIKKTLKGKPTYVPTTTGLDYALRRARVVADPISAKTDLIVTDNTLELVTETSAGLVEDLVPFEHPDIKVSISAAMVQTSMGVCGEMAIMNNCTAFRNGNKVLQLVANLG